MDNFCWNIRCYNTLDCVSEHKCEIKREISKCPVHSTSKDAVGTQSTMYSKRA